jgi:hypothetical protein
MGPVVPVTQYYMSEVLYLQQHPCEKIIPFIGLVMFTRVCHNAECLCKHIFSNVAQTLINRIRNVPSFLVLSFFQCLKDVVDSPSGDTRPDEDDSSSGSGSELPPVDSHTDVSHSESKSLLQ